jgi:hypothetical protein
MQQTQQGWPDMVVPAVLALTLVALLAVRDGRLRAAAIADRESLLVITYSLVLSWTVQLSWLSPRRPGWILLAAAPPADLPY